jgi:triosephosphate isomerase
MMRKKIVAGNWKMNKNLSEGIQLAKEVEALAAEVNNGAIVIVATPFIHLAEIKKGLNKVKLSSQNCAVEANGAYTGEVSAEMVASTGAEYVIIGHSERRNYYKEDNATLNKKVKIALANHLKPIYCIGEVLAEREANIHFEVVKKQLVEGVFNLPEADFSKIVIAYEPVWAIGTGKTATSAQAQEMHAFIRKEIAAKYGKTIADETTILYGGSCNDKNAAELFANPDVDGGLIGGASLKAEQFITIVKAFN